MKKILLIGLVLSSLIFNLSVLNAEEKQKFKLSEKGTVIDQFGYDSKLTTEEYQKFPEDKYREMIFNYHYGFGEEKTGKFHYMLLDKGLKFFKQKIINDETILGNASIDFTFATDLEFLPVTHMLLKYSKTRPEFIKDIIDVLNRWNNVYGKKKIKLRNYMTKTYFTEDYYHGFSKQYGISVDTVISYYFDIYEKILMDFYNGDNEYLRYQAAKGLFRNYDLFYGKNKKRTLKEVEKAYLEILNSEESKEIRKEIKKSFYPKSNNNKKKLKNDRSILKWEADNSASYCIAHYDSVNYNPAYTSFYGEDCANFGSQCLIAGNYDLSSAVGVVTNTVPHSNGEITIVKCVALNEYLTTHRTDIKSEMTTEIPNWYKQGDIALLGHTYNNNTYLHTIICHLNTDGSGELRFGYHSEIG